ncbi:HD domain-containing protein [Phaeovulum vinaykumarii]|nr:HD domain-containing protein [Phaeovulum vinaykumarii]
MAFLAEADRLKTVLRASLLSDGSRRENSGEHSWHVALYALVLADHAGPEVDIDRVIRMLLIHDLVEIDAGDHPIHGHNHDAAAQELAERAAATRLFGMLPPAQGAALRALWDEFEAAETPSAQFAKSLDRVQPVVQNLVVDGGPWERFGVTWDKLAQRVGRPIARGAPALWDWVAPRVRAWFDRNG